MFVIDRQVGGPISQHLLNLLRFLGNLLFQPSFLEGYMELHGECVPLLSKHFGILISRSTTSILVIFYCRNLSGPLVNLTEENKKEELLVVLNVCGCSIMQISV